MAALDLEIGLALPGDAVQIADLACDLIEVDLGWTYRPQRVRALIFDPDVVTLVARHGPDVVGFSIMQFSDERAHLVLLAVRPTHQRTGVARRLLEWLLESAAVAGMASVHVELRVTNEAGFAFYRAMGFAPTLRVEGYYRGRETALRMLRMLRVPAE
ncbi:MAG: GNAT family N-acetyltransferase [Candidatus Levyibacteriota bacterium]